MKIKVLKFGGTSVATDEFRRIAAQKVIDAKESGFWPVVVVSAIGRKGSPYATDTLLAALTEVDPLITPDARETDLMLACGEIMSTCIFAHTLKSLGHPASAMTGGQAGLVTDAAHGNARILEVKPDGVLNVIKQERIPVVCGFQGRSQEARGAVYGEITTLGRGGSDTTASALGAALGAAVVEIYTDVDGVKTSDPRMVPHAPTLAKMTYEEIAEIAHLGAKVVHPRAAEIAMKFGISLWIKSTFSNHPGTEVVQRELLPGRRVTGVTHTGKLVYVQFEADIGKDKVPLQSRIYGLLATQKMQLMMLTDHPSGFGFAVAREQFSELMQTLDGLVIPLGENSSTYLLQMGKKPSGEVVSQEKMLGNHAFGSPLKKVIADLDENCTMVSLVAHDFLQQPGIYLRVIKTLQEKGIEVLQTSDSPLSLSILVAESDCETAVRILHDEFELAVAV